MKTTFNSQKIHFIGIGGISLSALAKLMLRYGAVVSGSDAVASEVTCELEALGAKVWIGSHPELIDADTVVFTSALRTDDKELVFAKQAGLKVFERHEFLGEISKRFKKVVAVSGTHGKTTTTGMLTAIFSRAKKSFTAHIGGDVIGFSNLAVFGDEYFITEACEYRRSFLSLKPDIAVILNIESDHPDCFKNDSELKDAFSKFAESARDGTVIVNEDYKDICKYGHFVTFANKNSEISDCTYQAVRQNGNSEKFDILRCGRKLCDIELAIRGEHNILNATAAFAAAYECGVAVSDIKSALEKFQGVKRRFELMGNVKGAKIIFDYAHHPSEIKAAISVARKLYPRLAVMFQPHTYSRTQSLLKSFVTCFSEADLLAVLPTYPARERECDGLAADKFFVELLRSHEKTALTSRYRLLDNLDEGAHYIEKMAYEYDCFLVLGAGDVIKIAEMLHYDLATE